MKMKIEIKKNNAPLEGDWVYVIRLGSDDEVTRIGYNNPCNLSDLNHVRGHVWKELRSMRKSLTMLRPHSVGCIDKCMDECMNEIVDSTVDYINGTSDPTGTTQQLAIHRWHYAEMNAASIIERNIAELMRMYWMAVA